MTIPFRRDHSDADRLNDLLDAMRSGTRAPDASADEANHLARTARQFRGLADRAASVDPAPATTFDAIWEDMMSAHTLAPPLPIEPGPTTPITPETHRVPTVPGMPHQSRWQSLLSAAILVVLLAGLVATAWNLRGTGDGGSNDPDESARLAATAMQDGTPEASPAASSDDWTAWVTPEECTVEPMTTEEYADIMREEPDISGRSYEIVELIDPEMAETIIQTARAYEACEEQHATDQQRSLETDSRIFYRTANVNRSVSADELERMSVENGMALSDQWPIQNPGPYSLVAPTSPPDELIETPPQPTNVDYVYEGTVFHPDSVVLLADGRVAIPETRIYWAGDLDTYSLEMMESLYAGHSDPPGILILENDDGQWRIDEQLPFCIGECDTYWELQPAKVHLHATPDTTPIASPAAPPTNATSGDWTAWVTPQECTAEPMDEQEIANILSSPDDADRSYTVSGQADPDSAQEAAESARTWRACVEYRMDDQRRGVETDAFIRMWEANISEPQPEYRQHQADRGQELSPQLGMLDATNFSVATTVEPPQDLLDKWEGYTTGPVPIVNSLAYNPGAALALEDGRILIPETTLMWDAESASSGMSHQTTSLQPVTGQVLILASEDGMWKVDELLYVCLGECDDFWSGFDELTVTPVATPMD